MSRLAVAIMHAPWAAARRANLAQLLRALGSAPDTAITVCRDSQQVPLVERKVHMRSVQRATLLAGLRLAPAGWVLFMEDDAIPVPDYLATVHKITHVPAGDHVVSFQSSRPSYYKAVESGARWYRSPDNMSTVAVLIPSRLVHHYLAWSREFVLPGYPYTDGLVALWCCSRRDPIWITCPSLIGHRDGPSLIGNHASTARTFLAFTPNVSCLGIDWAQGAVVDSQPAPSIYRDTRRWITNPAEAGLAHLS